MTATLTRLTPVSTGGNHACGLLEDGSAVCWGYNAEGEIGDGTTINRSTPAHVTGGLLFMAIDVGIVHTCALRGGEAYCWGANTVGQLGDGTNTTRLVPTRVNTGLAFDQISAGNALTCALSTGRAYCWGNHTLGGL